MSWIWLPEKEYPKHQRTKFDAISDQSTDTYVVAEFKKDYAFGKEISSVEMCFSADTEIQLFCNDRLIATGPAVVGGDFLGNGQPRQWYYASETTFAQAGERLNFFARVQMCPTRMYQYSKGHGGFMLSATITFADGSTEKIATDDTWLARKNGAYVNDSIYNGAIAPDEYVSAQITPDIWQAEIAPIPVREEKEIALGTIQLAAGQTLTKTFDLGKIYAGFVRLTVLDCETVETLLTFRENAEKGKTETAVLCGEDEYRSFHLQSAGNITVEATNKKNTEAVLHISFMTTCYPVTVEAETVTSDKEINDVLSLCRHTLKYCRQTHHLDSPRHCEPLACTGDYNIEALMTAFSFGDMRLAELDIERTAQLLRHNDGRMFHTTYSLIWVRMLYDVYQITGNLDLLKNCRDGLELLLNRFNGYVGQNGLIENAPDYMFVDWIYIDGLSMHHPPKALGQSVLNMLYYMALDYGQRIYTLLEDNAFATQCEKRKSALQKAVNTLLYDARKGIYFEGLNTPTPDGLLNQWHAQNVQKRYYLKHSNIMAAYTGICDEDTARMLIEKVMTESIEGNVQPYFLHYLLEAIYDHGLREKYTLSVIDRWKPAVKECNKGLVEGFFPPEPGYSFDHSHAWGGSPLYSLPKALTGLTIVEAGYKKIKLNPTLLGLESARVEIPTPYGMILCDMKQGQKPQVTVPEGVVLEMEAWAQ